MKFDLIEKFNSLNVQIRITLFLIFLGGIAAADYFFVMTWQMKVVAQTKEQTQSIKDNVDHIRNDRQRMEQIQKGKEAIKSELDKANSRIRSIEEVPTIIQEISKTAADVGVVLDQVMPQKPAQELLLKTVYGYYYSLPIVIQSNCGYHMFGRFLNRLEQSNLLFTVREFRLESNEKDPSNLSASIVLKVILLDKNPSADPKK